MKKKFSIISTAFVALIVLLVSSATLYAASISLSWQPNTEPDLAGYKIYYDANDSGNYQHILDVGNHPYYTFNNLTDGKIYRVSITAYDLYNNESDFSPEITFAAPEATTAEFKAVMMRLPTMTGKTAEITSTPKIRTIKLRILPKIH